MTYRFLITIFFFITWFNVFSQNAYPGISLKSIDVNTISEKKIAELSGWLSENNVTIAQFRIEAEKQGLSEESVNILVSKIENFKSEKESSLKIGKSKSSNFELNNLVSEAKIKPTEAIFGQELFQSGGAFFESAGNIPTPANYILGPGDHLEIDIFGISEGKFNPVVSSEGYIRIQGVGLILIGGLSMDEARLKIKKSLQPYFEGLITGQAELLVSLSNIRSIRVLITGEVKAPGTYTLPSVSTAFNALYACGGPGPNGSFRKIHIIRGNKIISKLDVYDFLKTGISKNNITLRDEDVIKVFTYDKRVQLLGQVKREGYFEVLDNETFKDLLELCGGFKENAYLSMVKVNRITGRFKSVADIKQSDFGLFHFQNGDIIYIDSIMNRFENRVTINGAVFRPGEFALENGMTIKDLIKKADGLKEDAFGSRSVIYRLNEDNTYSTLSFSPVKILEGTEKDFELKREDKVIIATRTDIQEDYQIEITGEVFKPGKYKYAKDMSVEDLIIIAGGLRESASLKRIVISRRRNDINRSINNSNLADVVQIEVNAVLEDSVIGRKMKLEKGDLISVFKKENIDELKSVQIKGEVLFPGVYTISKGNESILDLINRAGGITANGDLDGAVLLRPKNIALNESVILQNKVRALFLSTDSETVNNRVFEDQKLKYDLIAFDLAEMIKKPSSGNSLIIRENDILYIPVYKQTLKVSGEVLYPVRVKFDKHHSFRHYIREAGGFTVKAQKRRTYVVYANGKAKATRNFLFIKFYPELKNGCEIVIPPKEERKALTTLEMTTLITSISSLLLITFSILK